MWKGFDIIIDTGVDPRNLVRPAVARSQDEDRHGAPVAAPVFQNGQSVERRQAEVKHHGVIWLGVAKKMPVLAVRRTVDHIAGLFQGGHQLAVQIGIVFDNKNAHEIQLYD